MKIRVPATSANLGPGFDSCGLAVSKYLTLTIKEEAAEWFIEHDLSAAIPHDASNLIIQTALKIAPQLKPHRLYMETDIPPARGLGSSSSAIIAGIELGNQLQHLELSLAEKLDIATKIEGHPDNVAPALYGNFVIATYEDEVKAVCHNFPECDVIVYIPNEELLTSESRKVLPESLAYGEAVKASSIANVMIAAVLKGNLALAGEMMEKDLWHEKYREPLVPHLTQIRAASKQVGAYAAVLSGAGPAVLLLSPKEKSKEVVTALKFWQKKGSFEILTVDTQGVVIEP